MEPIIYCEYELQRTTTGYYDLDPLSAKQFASRKIYCLGNWEVANGHSGCNWSDNSVIDFGVAVINVCDHIRLMGSSFADDSQIIKRFTFP